MFSKLPTNINKTTGKFFILLGILLFFATGFLIWQRNTPTRLAFKLSQIKASAEKSEIVPLTISIPSLNLELPIIPAELKNGKWQATGEGVSYLISNPIPGETGNTIMYGHNWTNLLGSLPSLKPGSSIEIVYSDKTTRDFIVEFTSVVTPDQTSILNQTTDTRLTLYTCTGFLDSKRFVVTAVLKTNPSLGNSNHKTI